MLLRPEGTIHFANAQRLGRKMWSLVNDYAPRVLVVDMGAVPELEYTALRMFADGEERLAEAGTALWLVAMNPEVLAVVKRSPLWERLGRERTFFTLEEAVSNYRKLAATAPPAEAASALPCSA